MINIFGNILLCCALLFSLLQSLLPLIGYYRKNIYLLALARPAAIAQFIFILLAYLLLTYAFAINDFSIIYVAANSHRTLPMMYKLTAVWGGHEGSILLWILVLNIWTIIFSAISYDNKSLVLSMLGMISSCFLIFLLLTSNPFLATSTPQLGHDLNPLLQDPGFVIHPPMLYTGYVGFSVAFACTIASLLRGQLDETWAALTRQFAIAAWGFLTLGIALGSWWAYRVLGWGGFWFWDPVENASLLPWIAGTALIHVLILVEKRGIAKTWGALLAMICFILSLLGTFLVRSGVLISAHTFANDPARGVFLLLLLAIVTTLTLAIYLIQLPKVRSKNTKTFALFARESGLLLNSALLFTAMLTILLGTLYPLILDALHLGLISVGAPYFNIVMLPLVFLMMFFMGLVTYCRFKEQSFKQLFFLTWKKILGSIIVAIAVTWALYHQFDVMTIVSLSLSFWILISALPNFRTTKGMAIAHSGFAIFIMGVMLSSLLSVEQETRLKPGNAVNVGPYQFFFIATQNADGANYRGIRAEFEVIKNKKFITNLYPEKRIYHVREMVMSKVAIHPGIFRDLYIALGEPLDEDFWSVRIYYKPFIRFIWLGALLMMIGGLVGITKRKT